MILILAFRDFEIFRTQEIWGQPVISCSSAKGLKVRRENLRLSSRFFTVLAETNSNIMGDPELSNLEEVIISAFQDFNII